MKSLIIRQLDEKNEEIADTLISLGMSRPIAWILSYLKNGNDVTSVELERGTELRQPEVSTAMKELKQHGWINEREEKKTGRGRPYKIYSLKVGFDDIIAQLEENQRRGFEKKQLMIERLRKSRGY